MKTSTIFAAVIGLMAFQSFSFGGWAAATGSNSSRSAGAIGLAVNYWSSSSAVSASWARNPGYSPYRWRTWANRGWCATARGFTSTRRQWNFGDAWGWSTRTSAINTARYYTYSFSESWISGYNN